MSERYKKRVNKKPFHGYMERLRRRRGAAGASPASLRHKAPHDPAAPEKK
jgi:hypothetical protein